MLCLYYCIWVIVVYSLQSVFIHGDNDVGGEAFQLKEQSLIDRFNKYFYQANNSSNSVVHSKFVDFFKVTVFILIMMLMSYLPHVGFFSAWGRDAWGGFSLSFSRSIWGEQLVQGCYAVARVKFEPTTIIPLHPGVYVTALF